jgi:hypothetical protein
MWIKVVQEKRAYSYGKQNHRSKLCGRAFVLDPANSVITKDQRTLIERLLPERISLRGIYRAVGVGLQWLLQFMGGGFQRLPSICLSNIRQHLGSEPAAAGGRAG